MRAQEIRQNSEHNVQSVVFTLPEYICRDHLIDYMKKSGIETTIGTYALSLCKYYKQKYGAHNEVSRWLQENSITLPCYKGVDVDKVTDRIKKSGLW